MKYKYLTHYKFGLEGDEQRQIPKLLNEIAWNNYISLDKGVLIVKKHYAWDGSSIPHKKTLRILSLWLYNPDKYCKVASLVHDALCQLMRESRLPRHHKEFIDGLYRDMCVEGGMSARQANHRYKALRKFPNAGVYPEKNPRNKIFET